MNGDTFLSCSAAKFSYNAPRAVNDEADPAGPPSGAPRTWPVECLEEATMSTQESSYTFAVLAALTVAVVVTFAALVRAFGGAQFLA